MKPIRKFNFNLFIKIFLVFIPLLFLLCQCDKTSFNKGIGIYPGAADENFAPVIDKKNISYRNLAIHRPAYHSGSYDYNLTAQLVTDGIIDTILPSWLKISTSQLADIPRNEREYLIDNNWVTSVAAGGPEVWFQIELKGQGKLPVVDSISFFSAMVYDDSKPKGWTVTAMGSNNGLSWQKLGQISGIGHPGDTIPKQLRYFLRGLTRTFKSSLMLDANSQNNIFRLVFQSPNVSKWDIGSVFLYHNHKLLDISPSNTFSSAWMSEGNKQEWVKIDLGPDCWFDKVVLHWLHKPDNGLLQVSGDGLVWKDLAEVSKTTNKTEEIKLNKAVKSRYVRLLLNNASSGQHIILSEIEVFGKGGYTLKPKPMPVSSDESRIDLTGGGWKLQRVPLVNSIGENLSKAGFRDENWIIATVPGTVLTSYLDIGAIPEPNYADNQLMISESFFNSDFWYRNEFEVPVSFKKEHIYLNFDGINWKAVVYCNGKNIGGINGAFTRARFDITDNLIPGKKNAIAVKIIKNANPGMVKEQTEQSPDRNGGNLGGDNPTFHATVGWDWIPTVRGRDAGIWNDVYLTTTGPVTIENPFITTTLPNLKTANVNIDVTVKNNDQKIISGVLKGKLGDMSFEQALNLQASESVTVSFNHSNYNSLQIKNPKLWWPNGYGEQNLYDVELKFELQDKTISDHKEFKTGLRQINNVIKDGALNIYVNGKRFVGRGGNWGFPESLLRYRGREYDIAVKYHKDMNLTLIRNWVGQTGDDEFYEACDRHGIMVWQDFWLANPLDGPDPYDNEMFMQNAGDLVLKIRNHPSVVLYCGRNEGNPPEALDTALRNLIKYNHPEIQYISHSSIGPVSGFGPYMAMPSKFYFENRATTKLHSELGMANIVSMESLDEMMPDSVQWPIGRMWGIHDFCLHGAQNGETYKKLMDVNFGEINNLKDWISLAQFRNYEGYRAMYEAQGKNRMGLTIWMSHPSWPSFVWQTYDYYFEPTAAYFGVKKASEPLHIQLNALTDSIEIINYSVPDIAGLTAKTEIFDLAGNLKWENEMTISSKQDSRVLCFKLIKPAEITPVYFVRLKLLKDNKVLSENFYWQGMPGNEPLGDNYFYGKLTDNNYKAIRDIPKVLIKVSNSVNRKGNKWLLTTVLKNTSDKPALMVRLKVVKQKSGERILPVIYSDNYVSLMPGDEKTINMELYNSDTQGEKPVVVVSGFNIDD